MIIFLDDYHNIHTKKVPTDLQKTKVAHMASSMVDVHPQIPAIERTSVSPHRQVIVNTGGEDKICLGGADSTAVMTYINRGLQDMRNHFFDQLPTQMKNLNPGNFHRLVQNFRYTNNLCGFTCNCGMLEVTKCNDEKKANYSLKHSTAN